MKINEKELLDKAGLDPSWTVASVLTTNWQGIKDGRVVPMSSTKVKFEKTEQTTAEFVSAA